MEIRAEGVITKEDFEIAQNHMMAATKKAIKIKSPKLLGFFPMLVVGLTIGLGTGLLKIGPGIDYRTAFLVLGAVAAVFLIAIKYYKKAILKLPSDRGVILGKHRYMVKEDGLLEASENQSSILKWAGVLDVEESKEMLFVYVDSMAAHFIPKHFFANDNEFQKFRAAILSKCSHLPHVS